MKQLFSSILTSFQLRKVSWDVASYRIISALHADPPNLLASKYCRHGSVLPFLAISHRTCCGFCVYGYPIDGICSSHVQRRVWIYSCLGARSLQLPGKKLLDAAVDLPFALPTSVAGLTLATVYGTQGWIGQRLSQLGVQVLFSRLGVAVAMVFVSFPFVVRTLQPVLQDLELELEEVAWSLGASPWKTFCRVLLPSLLPALVTGMTLAFSRAIGEYGSIVIVSSNMPLKDLIAPVLIFQNLEQYEHTGATVIGTVVLLISLVLLLGVNAVQSWIEA